MPNGKNLVLIKPLYAMKAKEILKKAGIRGVKSYKLLYGTKQNIFAKFSQGYPDSSWYCKIKPDGKIIINTKYYNYPESVLNYNKTI